MIAALRRSNLQHNQSPRVPKGAPNKTNHLRYLVVIFLLFSSRSASVCATPLHRRLHPNVMIECENGVKYYADHVICTVPLGVIKESAETLFAPPLPLDKREAIEKLHFGTVNKIFLEYERPFLSPDVDEIVLLWDRAERELDIPMKDRWFRKIYSFAKQSDTLLIGWISGEEARCVYLTFFEGIETPHFDLCVSCCLIHFTSTPGSWRRSR